MRAQFDIVDMSATSHALIHVPHSSRNVPDWARSDIVLDDAGLAETLDAMTDAHTDLIAEQVGETSLFINRLSRLVVDPERFPDEREEMLAVGMGAVYTRGHNGQRIRDQVPHELISSVFEPYSRALQAQVAKILERHGRALIIDLHSYPKDRLPYELHHGPRPQICLGTDEVHTSPELAARAWDAFRGFEVAENTPFAGTYVPLDFYGSDSNVQSIMIEIRRDVYCDARGEAIPEAIAALAEATKALI